MSSSYLAEVVRKSSNEPVCVLWNATNSASSPSKMNILIYCTGNMQGTRRKEQGEKLDNKIFIG